MRKAITIQKFADAVRVANVRDDSSTSTSSTSSPVTLTQSLSSRSAKMQRVKASLLDVSSSSLKTDAAALSDSTTAQRTSPSTSTSTSKSSTSTSSTAVPPSLRDVVSDALFDQCRQRSLTIHRAGARRTSCRSRQGRAWPCTTDNNCGRTAIAGCCCFCDIVVIVVYGRLCSCIAVSYRVVVVNSNTVSEDAMARADRQRQERSINGRIHPEVEEEHQSVHCSRSTRSESIM